MKPIGIMFFGTPEFARYHLEALLGDERYKVKAVITQPDRPAGRKMQLQKSPVRVLAESHQIQVFTPASLKDPQALEELLGLDVEAVAVVAYGQIIPEKLLHAYPAKIVNVHGSLLPRWRGAAPIQRALMAGDKESGVSLQVMVKDLDAGDVIAERKLDLPQSMNALELHDQLKALGASMLCEEFSKYLQGEIQPQSQDANLVTHAAKIQKTECKINWNLKAEEVHNHIRGLAMGPYAWSSVSDVKFKFHKTSVVQTDEKFGKAGEILKAVGDQFRVACAQGCIDVLEIQPESKPRMDVKSFLLGRKFSKGACFG